MKISESHICFQMLWNKRLCRLQQWPQFLSSPQYEKDFCKTSKFPISSIWILTSKVVIRCFWTFQKEKVKVYIDEKYHHATDPSIRPKDRVANSNNGATMAPSSSKGSTLVKATEPNTSESSKNVDEYGKDIKDIPRSVWKLLTNKIYLVTCLGACMELIIVSGFIVFLPKYLETQFNLSKSMASMFTGGIAIPGNFFQLFTLHYITEGLTGQNVSL